MPAQLVSLENGPSILLDKPILLLGRHPECDIQIDSRKISRRHCCIAQVDDYLVVRDLASTNGIRINGIRINEGRLRAGDELTLGNSRYRVSWDSAVAVQPPPSQPAAPVSRKPTVRVPSPMAEIEDALLEACDEPVPLDEPGDAAPAPPSAKEEHFLLPEVLELMPNSDLFPQNPPSSPSSIHPAT
jgi:predicted component of type VI protein secretion system